MLTRRLFLLGIAFTISVVAWSLWRYSFLRDKTPQEYIQDLNHRKAAIRAMSAYELGKKKITEGVGPLITALDDASYEVRWNAAVALGNIGDPAAIPALKRSLNDSDSSVVMCAIRSLGMFRRPEITYEMVSYLKSNHPGIRLAACWSVGQLEDPNLASKLEPLLEDEEPDVRYGAALELARFGNGKSKPVLEEMTASKNRFYREKAAEALKQWP